MADEEGCFLACTFWQIEARLLRGQREQADSIFNAIVRALDHGVGVYSVICPRDSLI
jgi:hypothetical protein